MSHEDAVGFLRFLLMCAFAWGAWRLIKRILPRATATFKSFKSEPGKLDRYLLRGALIAVIVYVLTRI